MRARYTTVSLCLRYYAFDTTMNLVLRNCDPGTAKNPRF
jgi:hypothetical protein